LLASAFTALTLLTTRYQHTYFLLLWPPYRSWSLYVYSAIYGVIAAVLTFVLSTLIARDILRVEGLGLDNPGIRAVYIGLFTKSLMDFSLFSVGEQRFGFASVVQTVEPTLTRNIDLAEDHWVKVYMADRVGRYTDLDEVRRRIIGEIPQSLPDQEKAAFELDISKMDSVPQAMRSTLRQFGKRSFERIFPIL